MSTRTIHDARFAFSHWYPLFFTVNSTNNIVLWSKIGKKLLNPPFLILTHDAKFGTLMTLKIAFTNYELVLIALTQKGNSSRNLKMWYNMKHVLMLSCNRINAA